MYAYTQVTHTHMQYDHTLEIDAQTQKGNGQFGTARAPITNRATRHMPSNAISFPYLPLHKWIFSYYPVVAEWFRGHSSPEAPYFMTEKPSKRALWGF